MGDDAGGQPPSDELRISRKKSNLKQNLVAAVDQKRQGLTPEQIVSEPVRDRSPISRLLRSSTGLRARGNVIVSDRDPTDRIHEFDRDASDPFHVTDMDPTDPVGYPSDIILSDPF